MAETKMGTAQGTNISPKKWHFEDDFPIPKVGYVSSLEGNQKFQEVEDEAPRSCNLIWEPEVVWFRSYPPGPRMQSSQMKVLVGIPY